MKKEICPLLTMYATTFKTPEEYKDRDCLEKKCAWWISKCIFDDPDYKGHCAIVELALAFRALSDLEKDKELGRGLPR